MRKILFTIAILGLFVSGYLFTTYVTGGPIKCGGHGCDVLRASVYANFFGVPTPAYGLVFYFLLAGSALALTPASKRTLLVPLLLLTGSGVAVSAYLMYVSLFVIDALCTWCTASAVLSVLAFIVVWGMLPGYERRN